MTIANGFRHFFIHCRNLFHSTAMAKSRNFWYHILAVITVAIWGTTFVSTKILIGNGLNPTEIFLYRFVLAYAGILFVAGKRMFANNLWDELTLLLAGITGGSLYFITENTALQLTTASNVAMIIAITPLLTTLLSSLFFKSERLHRPMRVIAGSLIALVGVAAVVYNGNFVLKINPLGDVLSFAAAFSWAVYSLLIKRITKRYPTMFVTRKVFGYGILTMLLYQLVHPTTFHWSALTATSVWTNLLFLGLIASMACFAVWNLIVKRIGTVKPSNYLYINPVVTMITASLILGEQVTLLSLVGITGVLLGVYISEHKR